MSSFSLKNYRAEGLETIEKISAFVHAVGCVNNNRGSAILVSLPNANGESFRDLNPDNSFGSTSRSFQGNERARAEREGNHAVLLSSSHVFPCRESTAGVAISFLDQPVAGTAALLGRNPRPFSVRVRDEATFITSISEDAQRKAANKILYEQEKFKQDSAGLPALIPSPVIDLEQADEAEIGFSVTCCSVNPSRKNANGDYLMESEMLSATGRSYSVRTVSAGESFVSFKGKKNVRDDLFLVKPLPVPLLMSSITPTKTDDIHLMIVHIGGENSRRYIVRRVDKVYSDYCTYVKENDSPICSGGPVFNRKGDFIGIQHQNIDECICLFSISIVRYLFSTGLLGVCRPPISNVPINILHTVIASDRYASKTFNRQTFLKKQKQRNSDKLKGFIDIGSGGEQLADFKEVERLQRLRTAEIPVPQREPSFEEVYEEFFDSFESLMLMLRCFSYSPALAKKILQEIVRPEHLNDLKRVSADGGVGFILEVIDGHPQDEDLIVSALTALCRICLYEGNLTTFIQVDGVPSVIEILKEYIHEPRILQWGIYCLVQVTKDSAPQRLKTIEYFVKTQGFEMVLYIFRTHSAVSQNHLISWSTALLLNIITVNPKFVTVLVHEELPFYLLLKIEESKTEFACVSKLLKLFRYFLSSCAEFSPAHYSDDNERPLANCSPNEVNHFFLRKLCADNADHICVCMIDIIILTTDGQRSDSTEEILMSVLDIIACCLKWGIDFSVEVRRQLEGTFQKIRSCCRDPSNLSEWVQVVEQLLGGCGRQGVQDLFGTELTEGVKNVN